MPPSSGFAGTVQEYAVTAPAGSDAAPIRIGAANKARVFYEVQNTGSQLGFFTWDQAFPNDTPRAVALLPGQGRKWTIGTFVPTQAASFSSVLGTTFSVIEGIDGSRANG